jgi:hypothetical protein
LRTTFPAEQLFTVTVITVPEVAEGTNTQPVADPVAAEFEKSAAAIPVTESLNVTV